MQRPAGTGARIEAGITTASMVLVVSVAMVFAILICVDVETCRRYWHLNAWTGDILVPAMALGPVSLWYVLATAWHHATFGMRQQSLRFGGADGSEVSRQRCAMRAIAGILTLPLCPVSLILLLVNGRSLADRVSRVAVVVVPSDASKQAV